MHSIARTSRFALLAVVALLAALFAAGCSDDSTFEPDAAPPPDGGAHGGSIFDPTRVLDIAIELDPADWHTLRHQMRSFVDILTGDCQAAPYPSPFTYFRGTITVEGTTVSNVAVRKKGFMGSLSSERPSLRVKLDEYVPDRKVWGRDDLVLNNSIQDASSVKQCLGFAVFAAAGLPSPRCNFAHLVVNGEDLGIYVHVEAIDKDFLRRHFADATGNLYEGTFSDFRAGWLDTFEISTNQATADRSELIALADALTLPDDQMVAAVEALIDLDRFIDFWVIESILHHKDSYTANANNFHVYADPTSNQLVFLPYGLDQSMEVRESPHVSVTRTFSRGILAKRLLDIPETRARYVARMSQLLDTIWDPAALTAEVERMRLLIQPWAGPPYSTATEWDLDYETDLVKSFIETRAVQILAELGGAFESGQPRDTVCWPDIGSFTASFSTTHGTLASDIFIAGTGVVEATIDGVVDSGETVGARAGATADGFWYQIQVSARIGDGTYLLLDIALPGAALAPSTIPIDWVTNHVMLYRGDTPASYSTLVAFLGPATLVLDQAATVPGAPITGTITGSLAGFPESPTLAR